MLGRKERDQLELFIAGSLRQLVPDIISFLVLIGSLTCPGCVRQLPIATAPRTAGRASIQRPRFGSCLRDFSLASFMIAG